MIVQEAFENFIHSRNLKGVSDKTIESYRLHTVRFIGHVGYCTGMESITQEQIENFIECLYRDKLSIASISSYIRDTRIFLKWYEKVHSVQYNASEIPIPRTPKKLVHLYSPDEIALIFQSINTGIPWLDARNKSIIALMLDSGIRQCEVCSLERKNIHFDRLQMKVCGKGNKERYVPLGRFAMSVLRQYYELCPYDSERVFLSLYGDDLTCGAVKSMTWDLQQLLPFEFSSHKCRHNFATNYLVNQYEQTGQMDIYSLMSIMGHEDTITIQKYLHEAKNIIATRSCISHLDKVFDFVV